MLRSRTAMIALATAFAVATALVVPDYRESYAMVVKPFIVPLLIALPLATAAYHSTPVLIQAFAACVCAVLLLVHDAISGYLFSVWSGSLDSLSLGILLLTAIAQFTVALAVLVAFRLGWQHRHDG